ncbi:MAG: DNA mismatch repair endonuclease MutL [Muribaculaceae bacterium]|nr:DNA mismatch repair endonuclease MutL [Muribaculaceae bacterium]
MNSDVIRLLPDSVANQIAAGEVIQRPASVIKELVENSVDAGATAITIVIKDAGRTLIQVVDNGSGMSPTDARMAFERHATSKIASASDLYSLHTMGFRGEALPSIAAVAQIDLRTMRREDAVGTRLLVSESKFEAQEPVACAPGTNLMVKNIFFHMPARRKFLKKDSVELSHILREFERLALVNTDVDFTLIHNDVTMHQFLRGSFKQRIGALFGKTLESQLAPIGTETSLVHISGFVGMPRFAKRRGAPQFFFVNGRNMRHPLFHKAITRCYEQMIAPDTQPAYFINFEVAPETIDVNIHPQKYEIKFEHEQAIFQILEAAVKETLGKTQAAGALDFDAEQSPDIPLFAPDSTVSTPDEGTDSDFNPFAAPVSGGTPSPSLRAASWDRPSGASSRSDWEKLYENFSRRREESLGGLRASSMNTDSPADFSFGSLLDAQSDTLEAPAPACLHSPDGIIITVRRDGITFIHQQRAHIRIIYDRILRQMGDSPLASQKLIFPEDIELAPDRSALLQGLGEHLRELGFDVTHNGGPSWSIEAVPALLASVSPAEALSDLLGGLPPESLDGEAFRAPAALAMARSAAIAPGAPLSKAEMEGIVSDLFACDSPAITPDGLPVFTVITTPEIERRLS